MYKTKGCFEFFVHKMHRYMDVFEQEMSQGKIFKSF